MRYFDQRKYWLLAAIVMSLCLLMIWIKRVDLWPVDYSYQSAMDQYSQIFELDREIARYLNSAKAGTLNNYDDLTNSVKEIEQIIENTIARLRVDENTINNQLAVYLGEVKEKFSKKRVYVEYLKSDQAVIKNSLMFLPNAIVEYLAKSEERLNEETRQQFMGSINVNFYGSDSEYWLSNLTEAIEKASQSEVGGNKEKVKLIKKHAEIITNYQSKASEVFQALDELDFHSSLTDVIGETMSLYERNHKALAEIKLYLLLAISLLVLIVVKVFLDLRLQKKALKNDNILRSNMNNALSRLAEFDHCNSDIKFFENCVRIIVDVCNSDIAYIARFCDVDKTQLKTDFVLIHGEVADNFSYGLKGAPCEDVVKKGFCYVEEGVAEKYPDDKMLVDLNLQSYFGHVFFDHVGNPVGLFAVMNCSVTPADDWIKSLIDIFSTRISIEIERNNSLEALYEQKEQAFTTLSSIADGVIATDEKGVVTAINPAAEKLLSISSESVIHNSYAHELFSISSEEEIEHPVKKCLRQHKTMLIKDRVIVAFNSDKGLALQVSVAPILTDAKKLLGAIVVFHDVSQERRFRSELAYQASHDALTGLLNRRALEFELKNILDDFKTSCIYSLMFIDLDKFKVVNDTCGHNAGDELLKKLSEILQGQVRELDVVARLGGDEFFILLRQCPLDAAKNIGEKILANIAAFRFFWEGNEFSISASIGLMQLSEPCSYTEVMSMVDQACLLAKTSGRNKICVYEDVDHSHIKQRDEILWVPYLHTALENDFFELYYQPIIDADDLGVAFDSVTHLEVLLRMRDKNKQIIMPHEFISAAERYDMMAKIDRWVVRNVMVGMSKNGPPTCLQAAQFVSINLSGQSLTDEGLLSFIQNQLVANDIDPTRLCFEITETSAIARQQNATQLMQALKSQGCQFALDDFGSGLSSYSYIKNLPADLLKIDKEFTKNLVDDEINRAIVKSVVNVVREIGMKSIAEGVEDTETGSILKSLGVDYLQGYGIGYPQPLQQTSPLSLRI